MAVTNPGAGPGADPNNPGVPQFDPNAFKTEFMGEVNKTLNGFAASMKKEFEKMMAPKPADNPNPNPVADPANPPEVPKDAKTVADLNVVVQNLNKKLNAALEETAAERKTRQETEAKLLEKDRVAQVRKAMEDISWASPKARQQFEDAILPKVKRDDEGSLIVETDKGVMSYDVFIQSEAQDSPHFLAPQGSGGAGASSGKKPGGSPRVNILDMTTEQIMALPKETRAAAFAENLRIANAG